MASLSDGVGLQEDDVMVAVCAGGNGFSEWQDYAGWTKLFDETSGGSSGGTSRMGVYWRKHGPTYLGALEFTQASSSNKAAVVGVFRGVEPVAPVVSAVKTGTGSSIVCQSVNAPVGESLHLLCGVNSDDDAVTDPVGYTRVDSEWSGTDSSNDARATLAWAEVGKGATGDQSFSMGASEDNIGVSLLFSPKAEGGQIRGVMGGLSSFGSLFALALHPILPLRPVFP